MPIPKFLRRHTFVRVNSIILLASLLVFAASLTAFIIASGQDTRLCDDIYSNCQEDTDGPPSPAWAVWVVDNIQIPLVLSVPIGLIALCLTVVSATVYAVKDGRDRQTGADVEMRNGQEKSDSRDSEQTK